MTSNQYDIQGRETWNNPTEFVTASQINPGDRVAEVGCGDGWFTFALEKVIRPRGMVYALDKQPSMLQILRAKCENWERILPLPCSDNDFELDTEEVDVVFHANTLHECQDAARHIAEIARVLKPGGRLVLIEWLWADEESQPGPPNAERLEPETVRELLESQNFTVDEIEDIGPYHYLVYATKSH